MELKDLNNEIMELLTKANKADIIASECKNYKDLIEEYKYLLADACKEIEELKPLLKVVQDLKQQNEELQEKVEDLQKCKSPSRKRLDYLEKREEKLCALEAGGVDDWEWFSESLEDAGYQDD